jgi:hypothetical protein
MTNMKLVSVVKLTVGLVTRWRLPNSLQPSELHVSSKTKQKCRSNLDRATDVGGMYEFTTEDKLSCSPLNNQQQSAHTEERKIARTVMLSQDNIYHAKTVDIHHRGVMFNLE